MGFLRRGSDKKYDEQAEKVSTKHQDKTKIRIRLFDSYGNKETINVHVKAEDNFLEKAKDKIAYLFGAGKK